MTPAQQTYFRNTYISFETEHRVVTLYKAGHAGGPAVFELPRNSIWRGRCDAPAADQVDKTISVRVLEKRPGEAAPTITDALCARPTADAGPVRGDNFRASEDFYLAVPESRPNHNCFAVFWTGAADTTVTLTRVDKSDL